jgi:predicted phage terminase large subunit-like protein
MSDTYDRTRHRLILQRLLAISEAQDQLIPFTQLMMPTPKHPDDAALSLYTAERFHRVMAAGLEELEKGTFTRLIINLPPRHGKTQLASKSFIPWYVGKNPGNSVIFGTYNEKFSGDIGRAVRDIMHHPAYAQVFPHAVLKQDSQASDRLETDQGGVLAFVGRGGTTTGRGGDILIVDDPTKDRQEADSPTLRDTTWTWFTQILGTRMMDDRARVLLIQTRWHEDDIVGRLTDPKNDYYDAEVAEKWKIIELPALAREDDVLGRKEGEALWPSRFGVSFLKDQRRQDPRGFSALYQGRPSPETGAFFKAEWLKTYNPSQLPKGLRYYCSSDHAVSIKQGADKTVLMSVGVDEDDNIYVLPDTVVRRMEAASQVEAMLTLIRNRRPLFWWAERSQISKSLGPFLRKRMLEEGTFCSIVEVTPVLDKQSRAQSIQGRMSMGKVFFPAHATWWSEARDQILKFPHDSHDDFVDSLAYIGLGLGLQTSFKPAQRAQINKPGTFGHLKQQRAEAARAARLSANGGW